MVKILDSNNYTLHDPIDTSRPSFMAFVAFTCHYGTYRPMEEEGGGGREGVGDICHEYILSMSERLKQCVKGVTCRVACERM